jgi:hypothetical protein
MLQQAIDTFLETSRDDDIMIVENDGPTNTNHVPASVVDLTEDALSPEIRKELSVE